MSHISDGEQSILVLNENLVIKYRLIESYSTNQDYVVLVSNEVLVTIKARFNSRL